MKSNMNQNRLLTVKSACEIYGIEGSILYHWIRYKKFPYYKPNKKILFRQSDFEKFLDDNRVASSPEFE